jgi:hypothetical protein
MKERLRPGFSILQWLFDAMDVSRRRALLLGTSFGLSGLSGCVRSPFGGVQLTLNLLNFDSQRHVLDVEMLRAEGTERSESIALNERFELQPAVSGSYRNEQPDILESRKYVVRAHLVGNRSVRGKYLFYPDCTGGEEPPEELYIVVNRDDEDEEPYISFDQNQCGRDSWVF